MTTGDSNMHRIGRQKGLSLLGWLTVIALAGFLAVVGLKLVPVYLEYFTVAEALEAVAQEKAVSKENKRMVWERISKRLDISYVGSVKAEHFSVEVKKGKTTLVLKWERREHLFGNLDIVAAFEKRVEAR